MLVGFSVTFLLCFRSKWTCRLSWLVFCLWAMWPLSLRRAVGLLKSVKPLGDGWRLQQWVTRNVDRNLVGMMLFPTGCVTARSVPARGCLCLRMWRFLKNKRFFWKCTVWPHNSICVHCYSPPKRCISASVSCVSGTSVLHSQHIPCWLHKTWAF